MKLGVTAGKFYPFHRGHELLIRTAREQVDHLVVLLAYTPEQELPGPLRAGWIRSVFPEVEVLEVLDDIPDASEPWALRTLEVLGGRRPDVVFTSEAYGDAYAHHLGARSVVVDAARERVPISGTALRADLGSHWSFLTPPVKAFFARRVRVVGVESSGTTTLAGALARHYGTSCVPEYGRIYWEGRRHAPGASAWEESEFVHIAAVQAASEDALAMRAERILICDTDPLATSVWHRRYRGCRSSATEQLAEGRRYDLTLLTEPDFPFVQDGTREGEAVRHEMHAWFVEAFERDGQRVLLVSGDHEQRMTTARAAIDPLLRFEPLRDP